MSKYKLVPVGPVGIVRTVGGYPDESEHTVEWFCKHKDLKDGDLLYTAPQPAPDVSALVEALEDIAGTHHHSASAGEYFAKVARAALAAYRKQGGGGDV